MAHVKLLDGREFDIPDGDTDLEAYYRGEGATISTTKDGAPSSLPAVFDGERYVDAASVEDVPVEPLPAGTDAEQGTPVNAEGTGEPPAGFTVPPNADGSFGPATLGPDGATAEVDGQTVELQPDPAEETWVANPVDDSTTTKRSNP